MDDKAQERFWRNVDKRGPEECWPWKRSLTKGYGSFGFNKRSMRATHAAVIIDGRIVEPGKVVMHLCDNPPCVNPKHLRVATQAENIRDMWGKGRGVQSPVALGAPGWQAYKTHCKRGHEFTPENTRMINGGKDRNCKKCCNMMDKQRRERAKAAKQSRLCNQEKIA